jgi:hypothetical protein
VITKVLLGVACPAAVALFVTAAILWDALDQRIRERNQARTERDLATCKAADLRVERDTAVRQVVRILGDQEKTQPLPHWSELLDASAAHDRAVTDLMEQQFRDGAS